MFIRCEHVAIVLILGLQVGQCQYDFFEVDSLWNLTARATSLTSNIASNSLKISAKLLNAAVGTSVRDFLIFIRNRVKTPPKLSGVVKQFENGSTFVMSAGVLQFDNDFRVRLEAADIRGFVVRCSDIAIKITYENFNFTDEKGVVSEGYVTGSIRKLDLSYKMVFLNKNCPLALESITVNSIRNPVVKLNSKTSFESPQLRAYLETLPKMWEQEIPKSLFNHLRLSPIGRGMLTCNEPNHKPDLLK